VGNVASVATGDDDVQQSFACSKVMVESCATADEQHVAAEKDCTKLVDLSQLPLSATSGEDGKDEEVDAKPCAMLTEHVVNGERDLSMEDRIGCIYQNQPPVEATAEEVGESDEAEVTQEDPLDRQFRGQQTRARHYWGTRLRRPAFNRFFSRSHRHDGTSDEDLQEPPCIRAPPTPCSYSTLKPQQLVYYIWNQSSQLENTDETELGALPPPTPATTATGTSLASTQLPATPVSRGFWSTVQEDMPYQGVYPAAVVRNTFIDIEATESQDEEFSTASRSTRSLSPSHWKADTLASFSTSHWHH